MSELPTAITLLGKGATNPALPTQNLKGLLEIINGNLVFSGGNFTYKIPLEHIDNISQYHKPESWGEEWRFFICFLLSAAIIFGTAGLGFFPLIWLFWWEYSPIEVQIMVKAWDEAHGLTATTVFSLGKRRRYREDAPKIIQEIWYERGEYRRGGNQGGQVIIRDF